MASLESRIAGAVARAERIQRRRYVGDRPQAVAPGTIELTVRQDPESGFWYPALWLQGGSVEPLKPHWFKWRAIRAGKKALVAAVAKAKGSDRIHIATAVVDERAYETYLLKEDSHE